MRDGGGRPEVVVFDDAAQAAGHVGRLIVAAVVATPEIVLGLATGRTMVPVYDRLRAAVARKEVSFARAQSFNLDEYVALGAADGASFAAGMRELLFAGADFAPGRTHLLDGMAADLDGEAARYGAAIGAAGGIELQVLGIGHNGHIGFNEPGSALDSETRVVRLSEATRAANRGLFPAGMEVPRQAITMGIATILRARRIVLLATGAGKAAAVAAAVAGSRRTECPASALQEHGATCFVCDRAAAAGLDR